MMQPLLFADVHQCRPMQVLQRQIAEVKEQMERVAGRRKHVAEALSGRLPDQSKTAEQMQDDVKAAGTLKVGYPLLPSLRCLRDPPLLLTLTTGNDEVAWVQAVLDGMASTSSSATAPDQATQPISAYADAVVTLLTCTKTSASEVITCFDPLPSESPHLNASQDAQET